VLDVDQRGRIKLSIKELLEDEPWRLPLPPWTR
jgi:ribosomal protein S1